MLVYDSMGVEAKLPYSLERL